MTETLKGQTILEVIMALTLIILFLSGIVVVELVAMRNMGYAQHVSIASKLANQQLERARTVRDSAGLDALGICGTKCYINGQLTPAPIIPTGIYAQSLILEPATSSDCPLPQVTITPTPVSYKATIIVSWSQGETTITPAPEVKISSCLTDWR